MILLIDNYDSFTYNLRDYILQSGQTCEVRRNDESDLLTIPLEDYDGVILSPGPGRPQDAGHLMKFIETAYQKLPILGVCLGHQALGAFFGAKVVKAEKPMHGKISQISLVNDVIFEGIEESTEVVRYHSLVLNQVPNHFDILAKAKNGEIMAMKHQQLYIYGFQFHPEAVLTKGGLLMMKNWINLAMDQKLK